MLRAGPAESGLGELHHTIEGETKQQFLQGEPELAAFLALREVEIRVRRLGDFSDTDIGVDLMNRAFCEGGPLANPALPAAEREGLMALFRGAMGVFKNPPSHRSVRFDDPAFARDVIHLADLLHRILDEHEGSQ